MWCKSIPSFLIWFRQLFLKVCRYSLTVNGLNSGVTCGREVRSSGWGQPWEGLLSVVAIDSLVVERSVTNTDDSPSQDYFLDQTTRSIHILYAWVAQSIPRPRRLSLWFMVGKRQYLPPPPPLHLLQLFIQFFNMYPGLRVHSPLLAQEGQLKWRSLQFTVKTKHLSLYLSLKDVLQFGIVMPTR